MMAAAKKASEARTLGDYLAEAADLPEQAFIGMYVFFTITRKPRVTRDDVVQRFGEIGLDQSFVPNVIRAVDAFKKATGPEAGQLGYRLASGYEAKVMVRHVSQDRDSITRHFIRERVDSLGKHLDYTHVGDAVFYKRDRNDRSRGVGTERVKFTLHDPVLEPGERTELEGFANQINDAYETYKNYLYDQPLRGMLRDYILSLNAISVRPSGGLYFVHRDRWEVIRKLAALVETLADGCMFHVTPLVDLPEQREMLTQAFQDEVEQAVAKLVGEVRERRSNGRLDMAAVQNYAGQVKDIQARAMEHSELFSVSQDKSASALEIAHILLADIAGEVGL